MRDGFFDDLARALAAPMPRRGALRTIGAMLAVEVLQGFRPVGTAASGSQVGGCATRGCMGATEKVCCVPVGRYDGFHSTGCCGGPGREDCCIGLNNDVAHPEQMTWCCPKGKCSAQYGIVTERLGKGGPCAWDGCSGDEIECGHSCCKPGESCASAPLNLCCPGGTSACLCTERHIGLCCKPGTKCCASTRGAACCDVDRETCSDGACGCGPGFTSCEKSCCARGETCCRNEVGGACCKAGETCAELFGAPGNRNCCDNPRVLRVGGAAVCCPKGTVASGTACLPPS